MTDFDAIIIGAGAAGLMCAGEAARRGRRVLVLERASRFGEKIRISGGGRANFTNLHASPENYLSDNPRFCVSALARYTQHDFIALVEKHGIAYHERDHGQLFCDDSAQQIIDMLRDEARDAVIQTGTAVKRVSANGTGFAVETSRGPYAARALVIASGGPSIPKMGALAVSISCRSSSWTAASSRSIRPHTVQVRLCRAPPQFRQVRGHGGSTGKCQSSDAKV